MYSTWSSGLVERPDDQPSTPRHGLSSIGREVQENLIDLTRVDPDKPQAARQL